MCPCGNLTKFDKYACKTIIILPHTRIAGLEERVTRKSILLLVFSIAALATTFGGCAGTTTPAPITASEIIASSSEQMQSIDSFHFELEQEGGGTPIAMGLEMTSAVGDVARPDKLQTTISGTVAGMFIEVQIINIGEDIYMTNPLSHKWELLPAQFSILKVFNVNTGIGAVIKGIKDLARLDDGEVDGVPCYHLSGSIESETLRPITITSIEGASIPIQIWIGKDDFLPRSISLEGKITEAEAEGIVRTLTLSNFNAAVSIEAPSLG